MNAAIKKMRALPPEIMIAAGCLIAMLTWGPRSAMGAMQLPILDTTGMSTEAFAFALAIQNLIWGFGQPFAGAAADRFGTMRVLAGGGVLYAIGVALMPLSASPSTFTLTAGVLTGLGLSGCSLTLIVAALGKLVPPRMRPLAFGLASASGSFGQFVFSPVAGALIENTGWQWTAVIFAIALLSILPLSWCVASQSMTDQAKATGGEVVSFRDALMEAINTRSYMLIVIGFFTCGFQLQFITVHFQRYVVESGLSANVGYWAFALVGLFNVFGSIMSGWLCQRFPSRYVLASIYFSRSVITLIFIMLPPSPMNALIFGAVSGLLWLSTLAPTSTMVNQMFGTSYFGMLYGLAFCMHQVGGFCGVLMGGLMRAWTGSYDATWYFSIALGVASALISLPIIEKPVGRHAEKLAAAQ
jgi:MFS family permease